jgi:hypothetical protein
MNSLPQALTLFLVLAIVLVATVVGLSTGGIMMVGVLAAIPVVLLFASRTSTLFVFAMATYFTTLFVPGISTAISVSRIVTLASVGSLLVTLIISKNKKPDRSIARSFVLLYTGVVLTTMMVRGFGLRILGGDQWGGAEALVQYIYILIFLMRSNLILTEKEWVAGFMLMVAGAFLPMLADLAFIVTGGALYHQFIFISHTVGGVAASMYSDIIGASWWRVQRALIAAPNVIMLAFYLKGSSVIRYTGFAALIAFGLFLTGISGHRAAIIQVAAFTYFWSLISKRGNFIKTNIAAAFIALLVLILAYSTGPHLPHTFQRAIAFLPGINVSYLAKWDAKGTSNWRLDLWREAMVDWREYFWVGKGMTIPMDQIKQHYAIQAYNYYAGKRTDNLYSTILFRDYHNGSISLLLDLGIMGLISAYGIMIALSVEGFKTYNRHDWQSRRLGTMYGLVCATVCSKLFMFIFVYGDVRTILDFLFLGAIMRGLVQSDIKLAAGKLDPSDKAVSLSSFVRQPS